jgi:transposase
MVSDRPRSIRIKLAELFPALNERQRRLVAAAEAKDYGRGGISVVAAVTGMSRQTIYTGLNELSSGDFDERIRGAGGGRKKLTVSMPKLLDVLENIVGESTRGDPESPLRWTCKSVRNISKVLEKYGFYISRQSVANILHELDYSLQANKKSSEGKDAHPDRDEQFRYIATKAKSFMAKQYPVISVDTKKKELVGRYKNNGREWQYKGMPIEVLDHDFPDPSVPKAIPYGVYDVAENKGWVNVGITADTAEFAVESIRRWWKLMGSRRYGVPKNILITADSGGSNGYRIHLWKYELQRFANEYGFKIAVCHYPPGTSKWNKIEHRLFSFISQNWRGKPLIDYRTIVDLIASTTTKTGLVVKARIDRRNYPKGKKLTKMEIEQINISRAPFHGEWNYIIKPQNV